MIRTLIFAAFLGLGAPTVWWKGDRIHMTCPEIVHARETLARLMVNASNAHPDCQYGTAECYAESMIYVTAFDLATGLEELYNYQCAKA